MNIIYRINDVTIFIPSLCKLQAAEKEIKLSNKEAELLDRLCQKAGSIVLRHELLELLWPRQDSANASLNRVVSSLRRKFDALGHGNVVETFPRVGYLVSADIVIISQDEYQQENNDIQTHFTEKRHLFYGWTTAIITAFSIFTFLLTDNKSHQPVLPELISEHIKSTSVYIVKDSFKDEKSIIMDTLKHISKSIHLQDNHLSLLIGKKTISYISMNNKNKNTINRVYLIKDNQSIHEQISCITNELIRLNKNEKNNLNINNTHVKIYFYSECGQDANYVETDQQRKVIYNKNNNLILATITGLDK
ncbi:winged helix-turn-helix domain-containing protein, partial [Aeromonas jandaei]|uniref:winged helix-turn-helix domain-containing protein n=2 Tax=Aeromonas jandaei TaxID=650 RepID=UPI002B06217F